IGLTRGLGRAHLARAVVEAMAFQTRDVVEAMASASGRTVTTLRADGGASVMDLLLQLQADQLQVPVSRPQVQETTALGAAYLAGLAEGGWAPTAARGTGASRSMTAAHSASRSWRAWAASAARRPSTAVSSTRRAAVSRASRRGSLTLSVATRMSSTSTPSTWDTSVVS